MYLPDINARLRLAAGDILLLHSNALGHFFDGWVGEGRYVVVYVTHGIVDEGSPLVFCLFICIAERCPSVCVCVSLC